MYINLHLHHLHEEQQPQWIIYTIVFDQFNSSVRINLLQYSRFPWTFAFGTPWWQLSASLVPWCKRPLLFGLGILMAPVLSPLLLQSWQWWVDWQSLQSSQNLFWSDQFACVERETQFPEFWDQNSFINQIKCCRHVHQLPPDQLKTGHCKWGCPAPYKPSVYSGLLGRHTAHYWWVYYLLDDFSAESWWLSQPLWTVHWG